MNKPIQKVCVVGAGSAGFLSAVAFKRLIPDVDVTMVYSSKIPVVGVGESTTDIFPRFLHNQLRLDRKQFFTEVKPSWKFGVRFLWGQPHIPHFNYGFDQVFTARSKDLRLRARATAWMTPPIPATSGPSWIATYRPWSLIKAIIRCCRAAPITSPTRDSWRT